MKRLHPWAWLLGILGLVACRSEPLPGPRGWTRATSHMELHRAGAKGWLLNGRLAWRSSKTADTREQLEIREFQWLPNYPKPRSPNSRKKRIIRKPRRRLLHRIQLRATLDVAARVERLQMRVRTPKSDVSLTLDASSIQRRKGILSQRRPLKGKSDLLLHQRPGVLPVEFGRGAFWVLFARWLRHHRQKAPARLDVQFAWPPQRARWHLFRLAPRTARWKGKRTRVERWFARGIREAAQLWLSAKDGTFLQVQTMRFRMRRIGFVAKPHVRNWNIGTYTAQELRIPGGATTPLVGTLTIPRKQRPDKGYPGVLLLHGSGSSDRDGNTPSNRPDTYRKLAHQLSARGFAVLRFDKMGSGKSGLAPPSRRGISAILDDATAAARTLLQHPQLNKGCVALIGHSQGGWIAPAVALRLPGIRAIGAIGGPVRPAIEVSRTQMRLSLKNMHATPRETRHALAFQGHFMKKATLRIQRLKQKHTTRKPHKTSDKNQAVAFTKAQTPRGMFSIDALQRWQEANTKLSATERQLHWIIEHSYPSPLARLKRLKLPMLFLYAGKDFQVPPKPELRVIQKHLQHRKPPFETHTIPGLDHFFAKAATPSTLASYYDPRRELDDHVSKTLASWLQRTLPCTHP